MNRERVLERLRDPEFFSRTGTPGEIAAAADLIDGLGAQVWGLKQLSEAQSKIASALQAERDGLRKALADLREANRSCMAARGIDERNAALARLECAELQADALLTPAVSDADRG